MNLTIPYGKIPEVLLIGNGINRAFNFSSWSELLKKLSDNREVTLNGVPAPLQAVILTGDNVGKKMKEISPELTAAKAPTEEEDMLRRFADLGFDAILTANYTYEFERALTSEFNLGTGRVSKYRKVAFDESGKFAKSTLHTYFDLPDYDKPIWHIHGEAAKPDTMILGHYYYGKMLSAMQSYIPVLIRRHKASSKAKNDFECRSWLDYFLLGNVTIIGLGLDLSELDLWWLINTKKRNFSETKITFYKPDITPEQELLAEAYGVKVVKGDFDGDYKKYYEKLIESLYERRKL